MPFGLCVIPKFEEVDRHPKKGRMKNAPCQLTTIINKH